MDSMNSCSTFFNASWALKQDLENEEKYGTSNLEQIENLKKVIDEKVEERSEPIAEEKAEARFDAIKKDFELATMKQTIEAFLINKGNAISTLSPFITDHIDVNGQRLFRQDFIRDRIKRDPQYSGNQLIRNAYNGHWQITFQTKGPKYVSDVNVVAGLIVNARALGDCDSFDIYINGRDIPLHFKNGNLSTHNIMKELQLEDTSLDDKWVAEAFKRSLFMCSNIWFLTIPEHMGGYKLPDGSLTYVSSSSVIPGLEAYFSPEIKDHVFISHERSLDEVAKEYSLSLPKSWKIKSLDVDRVSCILLPFYEEKGLRLDRIKVVSYVSENEKHGIIAHSKRANYKSTVVKSISDRSTNVKEDLASMNDVTVIYSFSSTIESRGIADNKFNDIRLSLLGENGIERPVRNMVTILSETPASIPENLPAYYLSIDENIDFGDISMLQQLAGEFDFSLIQFLYSNQDAARRIVCKAIEQAHISVRRVRNAEITQSMIIFLATAHILKKFGIITENDLVSMINWFSDRATSRTCVTDKLVNDICAAISSSICSGEIKISRQNAPPYYINDGKTAFVADIDHSINVDAETFEAVFLARIKSTERRNLVLKALKEKRKLISTKSYKRDLKVTFDNGLEDYVSVYSLPNSILSKEAREIVEKSIISDRFHESNKVPEHFYPMIKHKNFDLVAGQVIKDYNTINPFIAISGSPGSGKTDLLMMQALQRAKAGDTVLILDPTNSFCEYEWIQHKVPKAIIDETMLFWDMSINGWLVDITEFNGCANVQQKRERMLSMLTSGSHITGSNQYSILVHAVGKIIDMLEKGESDLYCCVKKAFEDRAADRKVMSRVLSIFSMVADNQTKHMKWEDILCMRGRIIIVSCGNATVKSNVNPLDVVFDSFYSYKDAHRAGNVTLVLDEIQTMNLNEGAPIDIVLSKGRKLNISAFLASQRYSNGKDRLGRVFDYCDTKLFLTPMESCIEEVSAKTHIPVDVLRGFEQGNCAVVGPLYSMILGKNIPVSSALKGITYRPPYVGSYEDDNI